MNMPERMSCSTAALAIGATSIGFRKQSCSTHRMRVKICRLSAKYEIGLLAT